MPQGNGGVVGPANDPTTSTASGVWGLKEHAEAVGAGEWPVFIPPGRIERSLRFNSADSAYLSRTPASAGNRKTFTISCWMKRSSLGAIQTLFAAGASTGGPRVAFAFTASDTFGIGFNNSGSAWTEPTTTAVFRDVSAWYHIVIACDLTQGTDTNRVKFYVNNVQQTLTGTFPSDTDSPVNNTVEHSIGEYTAASANYFSGYIAEFYFVGGQALTPSSFGQTDPITGVWKPLTYTGPYGTNGFYLDFSDNTSTTTLGTDASGNGNDWTPNNFSVATVGVDYTNTSTYVVQGAQGDEGVSDHYKTFDGDITTSWQFYTTAGDRSNPYQPTTVTFASGIPYTSSVRVYWFAYPASNRNVTMNGGSYTSVGTGAGWITLATGSGTLNSITTLYTNSGGASSGFGQSFVTAIEVDGVILVDSSAADNDSLVDTPTPYGDDTGAGGEVRGNYATLNPLDIGQTSALANGNLNFTTSNNANYSICRGTFGLTSGKWYWELTMDSAAAANGVGIAKNNAALNNYLGADANGYGWQGSVGSVYNNGSGASYNGGATFTNGDVIGVALDMDAGTLVFYKNGASQGTAASSLTGAWFPAVSDMSSSSTASMTANFGQRPFAYTAPSGFKALCTTNLPEPTVLQGDDYFNTVLWTGNATARSITGVGFAPDFVWVKNRSSAFWHQLYDTVRGAAQALYSNTTDVEANAGTAGLTAFNSDGFSVGTDGGVNGNGNALVAWNWNAGGSNATNTDGTITSTVRANPTAGISVVTYTSPNSSSNQTVGHGLGVAPAMIFVKNRDSANNWDIYHKSLGYNASLIFTTAGTRSGAFGATIDSTIFTTINTYTHYLTTRYVAYCFAEVPGFSAFGSYTGNGSTDGPFIYTGFRPAFLIIKRTTSGSGGDWKMYDNKRNAFNVVDETLAPNAADAEIANNSFNSVDFVSNGVKLRGTGGLDSNASGSPYIYAAFAENPFKYALAR